MSDKTIELYHCSPLINTAQILELGLDPWQSKTRWLEIWLVEANLVSWAARHVADRHKYHITDIDLWKAQIDMAWVRNRCGGIYCCRHMIAPERLVHIGPAFEWINNASNNPQR